MKYLKRMAFLGLILGGTILIYSLYWNKNVVQLNLLYTSDGHGYILPSTAHWEKNNPKIGGLSALAGFLNRFDESYILTDSGDIFHGAPEGILTKGRVVIKLMNKLGYDAAAVGNHEFDFGEDVLRELAELAEFPLLAANIKEEDTSSIPAYLKKYTIETLNDVQIGIIGAITTDTADIVFSQHVEGLIFEEPQNIVQNLAERLRNEGCEIIVLLSHIGLDGDKELARNVDGIDVILGGHTHRRLHIPEKVGRTLICQPGHHFMNIGHLTLYYSRRERKILSYSNELIPLYVQKYGADEQIEYILDKELSEVTKKLSRIIGESSIRLPHRLSGKAKRHGELALGNWQADRMREALDVDFAFQNLGGIRASIPEGEINIRDIWKLSPFGNTLVKMTLTGKQIKELMEQCSSHPYSKLQVSGLKVIFNSSLPEGSRVLNIIFTDEEGREQEIEIEGEYTVVTNSFLAQGGSGYTVFKEGQEIEETPILLREIQVEYITNNSPISAEIESRRINVSIESGIH